MKTISASDFFANPAARHEWETGDVILVTTEGKPDLEVRKVASPKKKRNSARGAAKHISLIGDVTVKLGEDGWQ
jgi:hypothetical protein